MWGKKTRVGIYPAGPTHMHAPGSASWRAVWQLTPQLADSPLEYAYVSNGMVPRDFYGSGYLHGTLRATPAGSMFAQPTQRPVGVATPAGQLQSQGLVRGR